MIRYQISFRDSAAIHFVSDGTFVQERFDCGASGWFGRTAKPGLQFEAVERGRIMAGSDHHAADGLLRFNGERNRRSWRGSRSEDHFEMICGKHVGGSLSKLVGEETAVVAD